MGDRCRGRQSPKLSACCGFRPQTFSPHHTGKRNDCILWSQEHGTRMSVATGEARTSRELAYPHEIAANIGICLEGIKSGSFDDMEACSATNNY